MTEQIDLMKNLLQIESADATRDMILLHYIQKARSNILGYCNVNELPSIYDFIVVDYAVYLYRNRDAVGMTRKTEGEKSVSYEEMIPMSIRLALPLPRIKVGY
ncbi:head-tail connector protein [Aneurinibacillus aneurinilyticus]|jgi:hypothetical protein|uniref:head-tail connector protein n=1 Tax=Aneurinibacillus aneurinilyticus TaxID=1391 RepID=UPI0023F8ED14|nr:head-tail connector protein [Aneurinibacillus aneurinilyticus]MCI1693307.1 head-tail connector protein [Aneurinibacillus aneurinilyticus]